MGEGEVWLWVAAGATAGAVACGLLGVRRIAKGLMVAGVGATAIATLRLVQALVDDDFSLRYVADFSRRRAGTPYRVAALWGGMAGSLLFFALVAGVVGVASLARLRGRPKAQATVVVVVGSLVATLVGLVLTLANPFERLELPPVDGHGMPPILEHPAMLYHPPLLYLGLATLTGPFALSVAGLLGWLGDAWVPMVRRWLLVPWVLLGLGMVAGAHWAYVELGWGGYWAWDPVENTALLPWLAVSLALHAGIRDRRGRAQAAYTCLAFLLALLGTTLTRSGAVPSVHAFAESGSIGRALAALVAITTAAVVVLFVTTRRPREHPSTTPGTWLIPAALGIGTALLAIVLVGTVTPLIARDRVVEGSYFASFAGPLAAAALGLLALRKNQVPAAIGAIAGVVVVLAAGGHSRLPQLVLAAAAGAATGSALAAAATARRRGPHLAHAGIGVLLLGVAGTATGRTVDLTVRPGETVEVLGSHIRYEGVRVDEGRHAVVADVRIDGDRRHPSLASYPDLGRVLPETSLVSTPWRDVQVGLANANDDQAAILKVGVHPLQMWVWWGGLTIVAAGALTAFEQARRSVQRREERQQRLVHGERALLLQPVARVGDHGDAA